jgi:hypothetical protein
VILVSALGSLDIRWPIGFIFTIYGVLLLAYGAISSRGLVIINGDRMNVDLIWGGAFLVFGVFMGGLAVGASRRAPR